MVTVNPYLRVIALGIDKDEILGTSFTVDVAKRQYLVTARHVIDGLAFNQHNKAEVRLKYADGWKRVNVTLVGKGGPDLDIAVLASEKQLTEPKYTFPPTSTGVAMGQDCYFLGFPFGMHFSIPHMLNLPHAFTKKATLAMIEEGQPADAPRRVFLDGLNNPGFSGGPIIFTPQNPPLAKPEYRVLGVISGYRFNPASLHGPSGTAAGLYIQENTGITIGYHIGHALEFIKRNPIGAPIT